MENTETGKLLASRPNAYGWLGFQRFLLFMFILLGIIMFFNTVYIVCRGLIKYSVIIETSRELAGSKGDEIKMKEFLVNYIEPIKYKAILYSFFLSLSFFIIARYCQKTINRNRYILRLEEELKKVQPSSF